MGDAFRIAVSSTEESTIVSTRSVVEEQCGERKGERVRFPSQRRREATSRSKGSCNGRNKEAWKDLFGRFLNWPYYPNSEAVFVMRKTADCRSPLDGEVERCGTTMVVRAWRRTRNRRARKRMLRADVHSRSPLLPHCFTCISETAGRCGLDRRREGRRAAISALHQHRDRSKCRHSNLEDTACDY